MLSERLRPSEAAERMDDPHCDLASLRKALDNLAFSNRRFGGTAAVWRLLSRMLVHATPGTLRLLDIGSGRGELTRDVSRRLVADGWRPQVFLSDLHMGTLRLGRQTGSACGVGCEFGSERLVRLSAARLPFADRSIDVAIATTMLHHLEDEEAIRFFAEISRVVRIGWTVVDLRRSRLAFALVRGLSATVWRGSPYSRVDGPLSVRRSFRPHEVRTLLDRAGVARAEVMSLGPLRLAARWRRN